MTDARRDANFVPTLIAASSANGTSIIAIKADPVTHGLEVDDASTGTDHGPAYAVRDSNHVPVMLCVSADDGVTPVELYADPLTGNLLIDSN